MSGWNVRCQSLQKTCRDCPYANFFRALSNFLASSGVALWVNSRGISSKVRSHIISMRKHAVEKLDYDITLIAGPAMVGQYLKASARKFTHLHTSLPIKNGVSNA